MTEANGTAMFADPFTDPLRAYFVTLRKGRRVSQESLADQIGMGRRTYVAWERGETKSLKAQYAQAMIRVLGGAREHLDQIGRMTPSEAKELAESWLTLSQTERAQLNDSAHKLRRVIELAEDDPARLEEVIRQVQRIARDDAEFLTWLSGYLAGRESHRPGQE